MRAWLLVLIAGVLEVGFAFALKKMAADWRWIGLFLLCAPVSFFLLTQALRTLPIGSVYAVWTGIGAAGTVLLGIVALGEPAQVTRLAAVALIVVGVIAVQMTTSAG
jgi:quaternary ammonium compound-resistance protein SugE